MPGTTTNYLLNEDGGYLLWEDGGRIILDEVLPAGSVFDVPLGRHLRPHTESRAIAVDLQ